MTPPRLLGYAVAVFVTAVAVGSAHHGTATDPVASPQGPAPAPAARLLPPQVAPTVPDLSESVAVVAPPPAPE
ncbi:hypothetical protein ACFFRS_20285, partial [Saccharopolyspora hordei]